MGIAGMAKGRNRSDHGSRRDGVRGSRRELGQVERKLRSSWARQASDVHLHGPAHRQSQTIVPERLARGDRSTASSRNATLHKAVPFFIALRCLGRSIRCRPTATRNPCRVNEIASVAPNGTFPASGDFQRGAVFSYRSSRKQVSFPIEEASNVWSEAVRLSSMRLHGGQKPGSAVGFTSRSLR